MSRLYYLKKGKWPLTSKPEDENDNPQTQCLEVSLNWLSLYWQTKRGCARECVRLHVWVGRVTTLACILTRFIRLSHFFSRFSPIFGFSFFPFRILVFCVFTFFSCFSRFSHSCLLHLHSSVSHSCLRRGLRRSVMSFGLRFLFSFFK